MRLGIWGIASVLFLALVPAAYAGERYAAPAGTGTECTRAKPCELKEAVVGAKGGDEVIITAGTYTLTLGVPPPGFPNVQIHGDTSGPMPKVTGSFGGPAFSLFQPGDSLSYVEIENNSTSGTGVNCSSSKVERVRVRTVGFNATGAFAATDCAIRNSLFRVEGLGSHGLRTASNGGGGTTTATARNTTVIASGSSSVGVSAEYNDPVTGDFTLELLNSIVQGAEVDLEARSGGKGNGNISATHSNFDTTKPLETAKVIDAGGNQTAAPLFVNAETGDFHEAAGSPTIDAGIAGELGPLDLDGSPRVLGTAPDIGAYETLNPPKALPVVAALESLKVGPNAFRAAKSGGAIASKAKKPKAKGPVGTTVTYSLSAGGTVTVKFSVEQLTTGRKAGRKCVKQTAANKGKAKCTLAKKLPGGFSDGGKTGSNHFKFTGRLGSKALKPGRYRLVGSAGGVDKSASFTITG